MSQPNTDIDRLINEIHAELYLLRIEKEKAANAHTNQMAVLEQGLFDSKRRLVRFRKTNTIRLHTYAAAVQHVRSKDRFSRHMISMEGQLCQNLHQMNVQDNQLRIINSAATDIQRAYQISHDGVLRGKQTGEHVLMKAIVELDDENVARKKKLEQRADEQRAIVRELKRELQEKCPIAFPPPKAVVASPASRGGFFNAAKKISFVLSMGGGSPASQSKSTIEKTSATFNNKATTKRSISLPYMPEMPPINHRMTCTPVA